MALKRVIYVGILIGKKDNTFIFIYLICLRIFKSFFFFQRLDCVFNLGFHMSFATLTLFHTLKSSLVRCAMVKYNVRLCALNGWLNLFRGSTCIQRSSTRQQTLWSRTTIQRPTTSTRTTWRLVAPLHPRFPPPFGAATGRVSANVGRPIAKRPKDRAPRSGGSTCEWVAPNTPLLHVRQMAKWLHV